MIKNLQGTNYFLMLALGATLIGFAPIFVKWSDLSPAAITFWRMFLALPLLIGFNYVANKKIFFKVINKLHKIVQQPYIANHQELFH